LSPRRNRYYSEQASYGGDTATLVGPPSLEIRNSHDDRLAPLSKVIGKLQCQTI